MTEEKVENLSLIQKLARIRSITEVVIKGKRGFNYNYADITEILAKITTGMKKYRVSLIPSITPGTGNVTQNVITSKKFDKQGKAYDQVTTEMLVTADMVFKWVNDDNSEDIIEVPWFITGSQADPSQAFGSGLTYCTRYFLTNYFQIAQPDSDVDNYRSKQREAEKTEDITIAGEIIKEFDTILRQFLRDFPDEKDNVKRFISRYVKDGDYTKIKEPKLASSLMEDFSAQFIKKE